MNDEELIQQFYQNDQEALKVIFERHKTPVFNFALRFIGNRADAEDAISHAFMMVCEKRYVVKPGASFKTWLYTVVRNVCLTRMRTRGRFVSLWGSTKETEDHPIDIEDQSPNVRSHLNQQEVSAVIQKAIGQLPSEQREALLLREYQGFSYEEISQVLECTLDKVKVLIFRARTQLKQTLPPAVLEGEGR